MKSADRYAEINGVRLHYVTAGEGPLMIFLHGFPEFWYAWRAQIDAFSRTHQVIAPDMRGYNLSEKPDDLLAYSLPTLAADIVGLIDHCGQERAILIGHDWGGVVAWEVARIAPDRLARLVIINAPHPMLFARELANNAEQRRASAYMDLFRTPQAEAILSANTYQALDQVLLTPGLHHGFFDQTDCDAYRVAWSQPGALTGSLNYYRANNLSDRSEQAAAASDALITVPTLVIWGEQDQAILPGNLDGLEHYVTDLTIERIPDGSHWIVHEYPEQVNQLIADFVYRGGQPH